MRTFGSEQSHAIKNVTKEKMRRKGTREKEKKREREIPK